MTTTSITFRADSTEERRVNEPREVDWLPILGPTAWLLGQHVTVTLDRHLAVGGSATWEVPVLAQRLGVNDGTLIKAIRRLERFKIIKGRDDGAYVIRRCWGTPSVRQREATARSRIPAVSPSE